MTQYFYSIDNGVSIFGRHIRIQIPCVIMRIPYILLGYTMYYCQLLSMSTNNIIPTPTTNTTPIPTTSTQPITENY